MPAGYEAAAALLEKAAGASNDPNVYYMLALAYKRQNKTAEARAALRKIAKPDAAAVFQMGMLSLSENVLPQAEEEFARAWAMDATSYETCYNLLLVRLTLGKVDACLELIPRGMELVAGRVEEERFLTVLRALLAACQKKEDAGGVAAVLSDLGPQDEQRMLKIVRSLGQLDTVHMLLKALSDARPRSVPVKEAYIESVLVKGRYLIDRCHWTEAEVLLRPFAKDRSCTKASQVALLTLLGTCAAMTQDFDGALTQFNNALKLAPTDARLNQNMAIVYELKGDLPAADPYWNKFFDHFDPSSPCPPDVPKYADKVVFEGLHRLANRYGEKEKWSSAVGYVQRAAQMRPDDPESLERLFHLYNNAKRPGDARKTLDQLRRLKPGEPQYELYELDLVEVKGLGDIEKMLTDIDKIRKKHPDDPRVEERAVSMVSSVIPLIGNICDQLTDNLGKVVDQVRNLPNYQINWAAVREVMRDLLKEFQKLRRIISKCQPLVNNDDQRRMVRDLSEHIDKKIEACRSMGA